MKKFRDLWKPTLVAAGVLCGGAAMAQVVTVPATCEVVLAGAGGIPGLGGTVGNGGIVVMPDPFDITGAGGDFIFSGGTITGWSLLGDLSIQTASSPPTAPVQTAGAVATQNIQSYNKSLRSAETGTPSTLARSKGRVTTTYTGAGCTVMTFDVYKKWGPLVTTPPNNNYGPPIAGPACWPSTNQLVAFSVDQIESDNILDAIGTDQYYWKLTNGLGVDLISTQPTAYYMAADRSSVTCNMSTAAFITWYSGGPYSIRCCYARSFPAWDNGTGLTSATATDCVSKPIDPAPSAPTFTTAIPSCLLYSATSFSAVFTGITGHTYSWTSTCGWVIAQTGTVPGPITLNVTGVNQGPCTLNLTDVGPCGSNVYSYTVNRTFNNTLVPLITMGSTCTAPGGTFQISLPVAAQGNCVNWTISPVPAPAWPFTDVNVNLHSIRTYTIPVGTCAAAYTITGANCSCPGNTASITMNVQPTMPTLSGPTCVPYNVGTPLQVYNASTPCGTISFVWSNTLGMTGSSTTSSISYAPVGTLTGGGTLVKVNAVGTNGCVGPANSILVNRTPPTPVVSIPCVNAGYAGYIGAAISNNAVPPAQSVFSIVGRAAGYTYTWTFAAGLGTPLSTTGTSVTVNTLGNVGNYACSVSVNNTAAPFCGPVVINFNVPVQFTTGVGVDNSVPGQSTVTATGGQTFYRLWDCTPGSYQGLGQATPSNFVLNVVGGDNYSIDITTLSGCHQLPPCVVTNYHSPLLNDGSDAVVADGLKCSQDDGSGVVISPNPNNGRFTVTLLNKVQEASATLYDASGQQVGKAKRLSNGTNRLGDDDIAPGVYTVRIELNGEIVSRQVAVVRD